MDNKLDDAAKEAYAAAEGAPVLNDLFRYLEMAIEKAKNDGPEKKPKRMNAATAVAYEKMKGE
jgi:hypothetical protein